MIIVQIFAILRKFVSIVLRGGVAEWSNAPLSKSGIPERVS